MKLHANLLEKSWAVSAVLILAAGWTPQAAFSAPPEVQIVRETPEVVFAPPGFDSNDHVQVILNGTFINTCHKLGPARAEVVPGSKSVRVTQESYVTDSPFCLQVLVPYTSVVDVGLLPAGNYSVEVAGESQNTDFGTLSIAPALDSSLMGPDNKLYALVEEVLYDGQVMTVKGKLPAACAKLKEIQVLTRKKNIVEVLPLVETIRPIESEDCATVLIPFEKKVALNLPWTGSTLFHVRSLNGQSLNKVVQIRAARR